MSFGSYRDPNIVSTIKAFDGSGAFLESDLDDGELLKAIIGTSGDLDPYQLPDAKAFTALTLHLAGVTDQIRQRIRDEVLAPGPSYPGVGNRCAKQLISAVACSAEDALDQAAEQGVNFSGSLWCCRDFAFMI